MQVAYLWYRRPKSDKAFLAILDFCRVFQATDPRDKIYGLLGHPGVHGYLERGRSLLTQTISSL
jgi:hypothetical protein